MIKSVRTAIRSNNIQENTYFHKKQKVFNNFGIWNEYINLRNLGDTKMKERFELYLKYIRDKFDNEVDVYCTLLENSQKYSKLIPSDKQVWRLSFLCEEIAFTPEKPFRSEFSDMPKIKPLSFSSIFKESVEKPVWNPDPNGVKLGDTISFVDTETGELNCFTISLASNLKEGKLNIDTPIAQALLGHIQNDNVIAKTPGGDRKLQLMSISRNN